MTSFGRLDCGFGYLLLVTSLFPKNAFRTLPTTIPRSHRRHSGPRPGISWLKALSVVLFLIGWNVWGLKTTVCKPCQYLGWILNQVQNDVVWGAWVGLGKLTKKLPALSPRTHSGPYQRPFPAPTDVIPGPDPESPG